MMNTALFKQRWLQVVLLLGFYLLIAPLLPPEIPRALYTCSLFIKDLLVWMLPLTVACFIAHAVASFQNKAPLFILTLLLFEAASNFSSVWYAFQSGKMASDFFPALAPSHAPSPFAPLWRLPWAPPPWWSADKGSLAGLLLGFLSTWTRAPLLIDCLNRAKTSAQFLLTRFFSRLIPLFVLGFVARMHQTGLFRHLVTQYPLLLFWLFATLALYLLFLFILGEGLSLAKILRAVRYLAPAGGIAFTSGCSLSTMPWTIEGTSKNLQRPELAQAVIPATTNIQQIGDCIANAFLCFLIYRQFHGYNPDWLTWLHFSLAFVLARFATAAILGGAIFVMLPIYEKYLSFDAEMIALILAFNVILDPLITCCNVVANGALCRVFEKVWLLATRSARANPSE